MYPIIFLIIMLFTSSALATEESRLKALENEIAKLSQSLAKDESKHESVSEKLKEIDIPYVQKKIKV